jgi:hypothetical protein
MRTNALRKQKLLAVTSATVFFFGLGCTTKATRVPNAAANAPVNNSYIDLVPGGRLRIIVPLLTSGGYRATTGAEQTSGNTMVMSVRNLTGYEISHYSIEDAGRARVRLRFASADMTKDGQTVHETRAPTLPFPLPARSLHVRLIYLVRNSASDHNMAIAASKRMDALNEFTERLKTDPSACGKPGDVFCSWVPAGIAVRPEAAGSSN